MAEIDTNPLTPVWPTPPARRIDPEEKEARERSRQNQREEEKKKKDDGDDDSSPHIDEYA